MKKITLLIIVFIMGGISASQAQVVADFVSETRGDTLVVKDFVAMGSVANSLGDLVEIDSLAPDTRVYELTQGGFYFHTRAVGVTTDRELHIAGEDATPHVMSSSETAPPRLIGTQVGDANRNGGFISYTTNTSIKNVIGGAHSTNESQGWTYFDASASGATLTLDNVYMEHTNWVFVQSNTYPDNSLKIFNSYFVNMNGNGCRRNGGVYDNVSNPTDTMWVENSTHVMGAGMLYKFRSFPVKKAVFNHNTFVNISNAVFETMGYQIDWTVTNNLFVNTNVQAYYPGLDVGETDQDLLPTGIINVDTLNATNNKVATIYLPDEYQNSDSTTWGNLRKILVDGNAVYWSSELDDIVSDTEEMHATFLDTVTGGPSNGELINSMMTMNTRTQAMFDNDDAWPLLSEGTWYMDGDPGFTEDFGMLDASAALGDFIEFTVASLPDANALVMTDMRTEANPGSGETFAISDWPIPVDLSYSNTTYLSGAYGGLPVGDLNWFPAQKASWNRDAEYTAIWAALNSGGTITSAEELEDSPKFIGLNQNYPNPFNPTTNISFKLPASQRVTLKVYDMLGREVATLLNNEFVNSGQNNVTFDAGNLASGVYMYVLRGNDFSVSKTMTLLK